MEYKIIIEDEEEIKLIEELLIHSKCKYNDLTTLFRQFLEAYGKIYLEWWKNKGWYITTNTPTSPHNISIPSISYSNDINTTDSTNEDLNKIIEDTSNENISTKEEYDEETPLEDLI